MVEGLGSREQSKKSKEQGAEEMINMIKGATQKILRKKGDCKNNLGSKETYCREQLGKNSGSLEMKAQF